MRPAERTARTLEVRAVLRHLRSEQGAAPLAPLCGYALRELVSAIYVDTPEKSSGKQVQRIHIKYDGLGFIPLEELMKRETA